MSSYHPITQSLWKLFQRPSPPVSITDIDNVLKNIVIQGQGGPSLPEEHQRKPLLLELWNMYQRPSPPVDIDEIDLAVKGQINKWFESGDNPTPQTPQDPNSQGLCYGVPIHPQQRTFANARPQLHATCCNGHQMSRSATHFYPDGSESERYVCSQCGDTRDIQIKGPSQGSGNQPQSQQPIPGVVGPSCCGAVMIQIGSTHDPVVGTMTRHYQCNLCRNVKTIHNTSQTAAKNAQQPPPGGQSLYPNPSSSWILHTLNGRVPEHCKKKMSWNGSSFKGKNSAGVTDHWRIDFKCSVCSYSLVVPCTRRDPNNQSTGAPYFATMSATPPKAPEHSTLEKARSLMETEYVMFTSRLRRNGVDWASIRESDKKYERSKMSIEDWASHVRDLVAENDGHEE